MRQFLGILLLFNIAGCAIHAEPRSCLRRSAGSAILRSSCLKISLPPRPAQAPTGSAFLAQIRYLSLPEREQLVVSQLLAGNFPEFLRDLKALSVTSVDSTGRLHTATYFVTADVMAVGSDEDFLRIPLTPVSAQKFARAIGCTLITRKISDDIYAHAEVKLSPVPLIKNREAPDAFYQHNQLIEAQRQGRPLKLLVAGIKKDVVLTNRLRGHEGHVAIYGWHKLNGQPIQPLYVGHLETYVDYSHGIRLMADTLIVDGKYMTVRAVLADPLLCGLLSDEGPILNAGYSPATHPAKLSLLFPKPKDRAVQHRDPLNPAPTSHRAPGLR